MGVFRLALWLLVLLAWPVLGQKKLAADAFRADLQHLQKAIFTAHPGVWQYNQADSLADFYRQIISRVPTDSVLFQQAMVSLHLMVAGVRDGHTSVQTPFYDQQTIVLPFTFQVLQDSVFILGNYSGDTSLRRGDQLLEINGEPVQTILSLGRLLHSGDGFNTSFQRAIASSYFGRYVSLLFGTYLRNQLLVRRAGMPVRRVEVRGMARAELIDLLQSASKVRRPALMPLLRMKETALYQDTAINDLAILRLNGFPNRHYKRFYKKTFRRLRRDHYQTLVLDLRYNTGGNVHNMGYLTAGLLKKPFSYRYIRARHTRSARFFNWKGKVIHALVWIRYNTDLRFKRKKTRTEKIYTWRVKPNKRHRFDGRVLVLTNGWSFSAAGMCASFLKNIGGATVIGAETGGGETSSCGGGYPQLRLPRTGFKVRFPLLRLEYNVNKPNRGRGVMPDYPITYSINDVLEGRDLEMAQVYRLLGKK